MAIKTKAQLKQYFETGKRPTHSQFSDLIDSLALLSEIPEITIRPYKVFSALLSVDNDGSIELPTYVVNYRLLEPNTIGDLNIYFTRNQKIRIESNMTMLGLLPFERRFLIIGGLRADYNFDSIIESDEINDFYIDLILNLKSDNASGPIIPGISDTPIFLNLPIEIRIYDEMDQIIKSPIDAIPLNL